MADRNAENGFNAEKLRGYLSSVCEQMEKLPENIRISPDGGQEITIPNLMHRSTQMHEELSKNPLPKESFLLVAFPKAGTHWIAEVMKMLIEQKTTHDDIPKESLFLDILPPSAIQDIHSGNNRLVYNTHFPLSFFPPSGIKHVKTVFVYRNPKDTLVSAYHHLLQENKEKKPTFDQLFEVFMGPAEMNIFGGWFGHLADCWDNHRENSDILCLSFEETKKDPSKAVKRIDAHLGTQASEEFIEQVVRATSFEAMKIGKSSSENHMRAVNSGSLYRKGDVGDWKNWFSEEQNRRLDERIQKWQIERKEPVPLVFEL